MFIEYILNLFAFFGFERNPLLQIPDKYTEISKVNQIEREYENKMESLV
jgi:hypothetical protein